MGTSILAIRSAKVTYPETPEKKPGLIPQDLRTTGPKDILQLGKSDPVSTEQSMNIVLERSMEKLRAVVDDARKALGIPENAQIDTSPEATATRIADFALGAFDKWTKQHANLVDEDARKQFADFIGGAIQQGISEARGILGSLNALTDEVDGNINKTWDIIQGRLNDFVANKK